MRLVHEIKMLDPQKTGLYVITDNDLKMIHSILLEMLDDIRWVCNEYNIKWGISGGCALGAVRHQGFIPWDDDVDIVFSRVEFEKFRKIYPKVGRREYELICPGENGYYAHLPRIFNTKTTAKTIQDSGRGKGLYVDIFILENTFDNFLLRILHGIQCTVYLFIISSVITRKQRDILIRYGSEKLKRKVLIRSCFGNLFGFWKPEKWIEMGIQCFSKVKNNHSKYVVSVTGSGHYFGEIYDRSKVCKYRELLFEDRKYPFMIDMDYFCKMRFGNNYMEIPAEEKREKHMYLSLDLNQ